MSLPSGAAVGVILPFLGAVLLTAVFAFFYMRRYKSRDVELSSLVTSVFALTIVLITSALLPVDIFIVSFMKESNGSFKEWADNATLRGTIEDSVLYTYYSLYGVVFLCIFILIPFMYFFYEEKNEDGFESNDRFWSAFKFTLCFIVVAMILFLLGAFLPLREAPPTNSTQWEKFEFLFDDLGKSRGEDAVAMVLSILSIIGMVNVVFYTGFGISSWPIGLIRGTKSAKTQFEEIQDQKNINQIRINILRDKERMSGRLTTKERRQLAQLEETERQTTAEEDLITEHRGSLWYKCRSVLRPVEITLGVAAACLGALIWISLLLTNIDKAMNSLGPKMGYALIERKLPNPIDITFVYLQKVFPLDYVLLLAVTWFLVLATISGIRNLGLRIFFIKMYKLRVKRTSPQGLLLTCATLMLTVLAINIFIYCVSPQYATYGSQHYTNDTAIFNGTNPVKICSNDATPDQCTMTRNSALLTRFFYKAWFFGAFYYWATWGFIGISALAFLYVILRKSKSVTDDLDNDDLEESDDEETLIRRRSHRNNGKVI